MRRINYLLLTSLTMVASCSQDRITGLQQDTAIEFRVVMDRQSKATGYTPANLTGFNVTAWKQETDRSVGAPYIDQEEFTRTTDGTYKSTANHFWPSGSLDFYAYAPAATAGNGLTRISELRYTVSPVADTDDQIDFLFAKNSGNKVDNALSGVTLNFRHVMSQIRVMVKNTNPNLRFVVTGWKIAKVDGLATFSFDNSLDTNGENTKTVSRDLWTGNDGSDATYVKQFDSRTVTDSNSTWGELSGSAILIPQVTDMATAYSGNTLNGSYIAVEMQVFNTSDNKEMVSRQWCCWPVRYDWAPGYRYNYTIDLAECGYKETGTGELEPVLDLVEVKFVDVTVDNWQPDGGAEIDLPLTDNTNTQPVQRYTDPCLRFHTENGLQTLYLCKGGQDNDTKLTYSLDEGKTWTALIYKDGADNGVEFGYDGNENRDLLLRGNGGFANYAGRSEDHEPLIVNSFMFSDPNQLVDCTGSVGSLTDYDNPSAPLFNKGQYFCLFLGCDALRTAPDLTATELTELCYSGMFSNCRNLTTAMANLPATTLKYNSYDNMFRDCSSLTAAPSISATILDENCCSQMFQGCSSLTAAPELHAEKMEMFCYGGMFYGCTSLTQAPVLKSTELAEGCYSNMFYGCTSLTTAPDLLATVYAKDSYINMFNGCSSLRYIKAMFLSDIPVFCTDWLEGVAADGTFIKNAAATWDESDFIPSGWTVQTATE